MTIILEAAPNVIISGIRKKSIQPERVNAGAKRVSEEAMAAFAGILDEIALEIGEQAVKIAKHSGRKTVQAGDIKLAAR